MTGPVTAATLLSWLRLTAGPKTLRYRILHVAGKLVRGGRRQRLKIRNLALGRPHSHNLYRVTATANTLASSNLFLQERKEIPGTWPRPWQAVGPTSYSNRKIRNRPAAQPPSPGQPSVRVNHRASHTKTISR